MNTKTDQPYKALVRLKNGSKEKYTIDRAAGGIEDAVKCLYDLPNIQVGIVLVPQSRSYVEPEAA